MALPERVYDLNEDDSSYGVFLRDENGKVLKATLNYPYEDKKYRLVWEDLIDYGKTVPAIYLDGENPGEYDRIHDTELIEKIFESCKNFLNMLNSVHTDGPATKHNDFSADSMPGFGMKNDIPKTEYKFCPNCGTKRAGQARFCTECGTRLG